VHFVVKFNHKVRRGGTEDIENKIFRELLKHKTMKKLLTIIALVALIFTATACQNNNRTNSGSSRETKKKANYYCSMHPSITSDKPGTCPKCGMKLVERDSVDKK